MLNITLGTAGHIDHGKTALVKSLTGCETDRLKEEKERGMSIDLGYAPCRIADLEVGIVDVPGHENFIKTMVAGACGMDGVILVVAADDGIMPQTREHLDILTLLGLRHGLVALTKIDRVDADAAAAGAGRPGRAAFAARFSKARRSCRCRTSPAKASTRFSRPWTTWCGPSRRKRADGVFRLPLDRAFSAKGFGTVVAGIPDRRRRSGSATKSSCCRTNITSRIKRIEVYGQPSDTVLWPASARPSTWATATPGEIRRGDVLTLPGYFTPAGVLRLPLAAAALRKARAEERRRSEIPHRHVGSQRHLLSAGGGRTARRRRALRPIPHEAADRGGPGRPVHPAHASRPSQTIGGGTIIEATDRRLKRNRPGVVEDLRAAGRGGRRRRPLRGICRPHGRRTLAVAEADLARRTKILPPGCKEILAPPRRASRKCSALGPGLYLHRAAAAEAGKRLWANLPSITTTPRKARA